MKRLSLWGKDHKGSARIIIVVSFLLLTTLGIITGSLLTDVGVSISSATMLVFAFVYFAGIAAYPSKSLKGKKLSAAAFYVRQKSCDLLLAASTFCMIVYFSNQPGAVFDYSTPLNAAIPAATSFPKDSTVKTYKPISVFSASMKDENGKQLKWKERKKLLKEQLRAIKNSKDPSDGGKAALIILSVVVALGLLYLVAALACNISCNGSEGAAIVLAIGGTALVIFLLVIAIRAITGRKKKVKEETGSKSGLSKSGKVVKGR